MSNDFGPSVFPPNLPIPDPPGANLLARIPIFLIGLGLLAYLGYTVYLEAVDWEMVRKPEGFTTAQGGLPTAPRAVLAHSGTNDATRCLECHDSPLSEETEKILHPQKEEETFDELPKGYDADFFDDEKFWAKSGLTLRKESQNNPGAVPIGPFSGDRTCLKCHPLEDFDRQHRGHAFQPFENCSMCHETHRPVDRPLLKDAYLETCTRCHESRF